VKQPESNPLQKELARSQEGGVHPDSDVLTAFAEKSLLAREHESVLAHLATCVQCREVLSIARDSAPESVNTAQPLPRPIHPPLSSWLPWVAAAACVLVVSSAVLIYEQKKPEIVARSTESTRTVNRADAEVPTVSAQPPLSPASTTKPGNAPGTLARSEEVPSHKVNSPAATSGSSAITPSVPLQEQSARSIPPHAEIANSNNYSAIETNAASVKSQAEVVSDATKQDRASSKQIARVKAAPSPTVSIQAGALAPLPNAAFVNRASAPMVRKTLNADAVRPHWRINDLGHLERSLGDGVWQSVAMHETSKLHVVSVSGSEVWAGGERLLLEHSADNGNTFESIKLPAKNGYDHVVAHIRLQNPEQVTVIADDGTSWESGDRGRTWK
jgi:hypothetical protein